ncbi:MAG: site-2 protease family protein [Candidatus Harrisonbacteria bacterium]|nr:site-2 protease family protein [Candidatus Harrisonbacteria bacterium]
MDEIVLLIFQLIVLIFSVMVHEVSHGAVAYRLGDETAKEMDRLNLNPLKHLDPIGSVFLPLFLILTRSPILFGWAKPVPYNPGNLKNPKMGSAIIGAAGPLANILLAVVFGILIRLIAPLLTLEAIAFDKQVSLNLSLIMLFNVIILINILLAIFNLVPIPPLDGSKILFALLPPKYYNVQRFLEEYGLWILLVFIFFDFQLIAPIINWFYYLIAGPFATF